jgi:hypothetical protein
MKRRSRLRVSSLELAGLENASSFEGGIEVGLHSQGGP